MDPEKLRAWWAARQGLDDSLQGHSAENVLSRTGWSRSVGGAAPYLTLFARAGLSRAAIDDAVAKAKIHELPTARGCTYVVPEADYAVALTIGQQFSPESEMRLARKFGVTDKEIGKLRTAILRAVESAPLDTDEIRKAVGAAIRGLGPEAAKKGVTTTLPVALGLMQSAGEIRRVPTNGRLDQQRYQYVAWKQNPLAKWKQTREETFIELSRRYFTWIGPARISEFQWFSGLGVKAAKDAVEPLRLADLGDGLLLPPQDRDAFEQFRVPVKPHYVLVSSLNSLMQLRRDVTSLLAPEDQSRDFTKGKKTLLDLSDHGIFDRGRLIGLWQFDPTNGVIAWNSFIKPDATLRDAVKRTEAFVREDLGDARAYSLDSPKSRAPRIVQMKKAGIP